jgi:sugar lactone lactonase YvrE
LAIIIVVFFDRERLLLASMSKYFISRTNPWLLHFSFFLLVTFTGVHHVSAQNIYTYAGGAFYNQGNATALPIGTIGGIATDNSGNLYIADLFSLHYRIMKVDVNTNVMKAIVSKVDHGLGDDGAIIPELDLPTSLAVDHNDNLYISDVSAQKIWRVGPSGVVTTICGTGLQGFSGDGGMAIAATINGPGGIAIDNSGNVYFSDSRNNRVRRIDAVTGVITTIAGTGLRTSSGDGGLAVNATFREPGGLAFDSHGDLIVCDTYGRCLRKINLSTGIISKVAGTGNKGYQGDGGLAVNAWLGDVPSLAVDANDNVYICDTDNAVIRMVNGATQVISTIAGGGEPYVFSGPATNLDLGFCLAVAVDNNGHVYVPEWSRSFVWKIDLASATMSIVAGNGSSHYVVEGGPATETEILPSSVLTDPDGNVYFGTSSVVYKIDQNGTTTAVAGSRFPIGYGDGSAALKATINGPYGMDFDSKGNLFITDHGQHVIRRVDKITKVITTVAGNGTQGGYSGDGVTATNAKLNWPTDVALDPAGNIYIADQLNHRIRKVDALTGLISTVAGTGEQGYDGEGKLAINSKLDSPYGISLGNNGKLYIADTGNNRIRKVDLTTGLISLVAGNGILGYNGDNIPATEASLARPQAVFVDRFNTIYIGESSRVRIVDVNGTISTVGGNGTVGFGGDNGEAVHAMLSYVNDITVDKDGNIFMADAGNRRIRKIVQEKKPQAINFTTIDNKTFGDNPFELNASASSALAVSYTSSNTSVITVVGNTVTIVAAGEAEVTATQAGNFGYAPALPVSRSINVEKASQVISFEVLPEKDLDDGHFLLTASASSGLPVSYTSNNEAVAVINGNVVSIKGTGNATITAHQIGDNNHLEAPPISRTLTVTSSATQTQEITFNELKPKSYGDDAFDLEATSSSRLKITYISSDNSVATVKGKTVTVIAPGTTVITATQQGNSVYKAATPAEQTLVVNKASQEIDFGGLPVAVSIDAEPFILGGNSTSDLNVSYLSGDTSIVRIKGKRVTVIAAGQVTITATQAGNDYFKEAKPVSKRLTVRKKSQTITFNEISPKAIGDQSFELDAASSSGLSVSYVSSNPSVATIEGAEVKIVGGGNTTITANQNGNETYEAAISISRSLIVGSITGSDPERQDSFTYPNPATNTLTLSLEEFKPNVPVSICLFNSQGQMMYILQTTDKNEITLDVSELASGVHCVSLSQRDRVIFKRFVKD